MEFESLCAAVLEFGCHVNPESRAFQRRYKRRLKEYEQITGTPQGWSPERAAMVAEVGQSLMDAAKKCLPRHVLRLAQEWQSSSPEQQKLLAASAYYALRPREATSALRKKDKEEPAAVEIEEEPEEENPFAWVDDSWDELESAQAMPFLYGKWGKCLLIKPNCLGMSLMLAAFCKLTGASWLYCHSVQPALNTYWEAEGLLNEKLIELFDQNRLINGDRVSETIRAVWERTVQKAETSRRIVPDFHHSVAIRTTDGTWISLDPYGLNFSELQDAHDLDGAYARLQTELPGSVELSEDKGALRSRLALVADLVVKTIETANALTCEFYTFPAGLMHGVDDVSHWGDEPYPYEGSRFDPHQTEDPNADPRVVPWFEAEGTDAPRDRSFGETLASALEAQSFLWRFECFEESMAHLFYTRVLEQLNGKWPEDTGHEWCLVLDADPRVGRERFLDQCAMALQEYEWDGQSRDEAMRRLIRELYITAARLWYKYTKEFEELETTSAHPVLEVSLPGPSMALAVLNHVSCWSVFQIEKEELLPYSDAQMFWHEAATIEGRESRPESLLAAAESRVRGLSVQHPAVRNKLAVLDQLRRGGSSGQAALSSRGVG